MRILGIDPGCTATGLCMIEPANRAASCPPPIPGLLWTIVEIATARGEVDDHIFAVREMVTGRGPDVAAVQVPAVQGQTAAFYRKGAKYSPMSIVKNAGHAARIAGVLEGLGIPVQRIPSKDCRGRGFKMDRELWELNWRYPLRTSEDARDAAQIALLGVAIYQRAVTEAKRVRREHERTGT